MEDFINKLLDDIHNFNPELSEQRQKEFNKMFVFGEDKDIGEEISFWIQKHGSLSCDIPSSEIIKFFKLNR